MGHQLGKELVHLEQADPKAGNDVEGEFEAHPSFLCASQPGPEAPGPEPSLVGFCLCISVFPFSLVLLEHLRGPCGCPGELHQQFTQLRPKCLPLWPRAALSVPHPTATGATSLPVTLPARSHSGISGPSLKEPGQVTPIR